MDRSLETIVRHVDNWKSDTQVVMEGGSPTPSRSASPLSRKFSVGAAPPTTWKRSAKEVLDDFTAVSDQIKEYKARIDLDPDEQRMLEVLRAKSKGLIKEMEN